MTDLEYVSSQVPLPAQLAQVAEEAAELIQAALKLCRTLDNSNPTPVSMCEAVSKFEEELADLLLCLEVLGYNSETFPRYRKAMNAKLVRWAERLRDARAAQEALLSNPGEPKEPTAPKECAETFGKRYSVYERGTDRPIVINGTSIQCAEALGITVGTFYKQVYRTRKGMPPKKYEIFIDEEDDPDEMADC